MSLNSRPGLANHERRPLSARPIGLALAALATCLALVVATAPSALAAPPKGTLTGTIVSSVGGAPVAGATVGIVGGGPSTTTNSSGVFSLSLAGGTYSIGVSKSGWISTTAGPYSVSSGKTTQTGAVPLTPYAYIVGRVTNAQDGQPISGARVAWYSSWADTDATGAFTITTVAGTRDLTVTKTGFASATVPGVTTNYGQTTDVGVIALSARGTLSGLVVDLETGQPVGGASMTSTAGGCSATTDGTGRFTASCLAGTYSITLSASGFATTTAGPYTVVTGQTTDAGTIQLPKTGSLSGTVVEAGSGSPLSGVTVLADSGQSATTGTNGTLLVSQVPAGSRSLTLTKGGYTTVTAGPFTVVGGQTVPVGTLQMSLGGTITGIALGSNGLPFSQGTVTVTGTTWSTSVDPSDGRFQIAQGAGTCTLTISGSWVKTTTTGPIQVQTGQTTDIGTLTLPAVGNLDGKVVDMDTGAALAGVVVRVREEPTISSTTDSYGWFRLSQVTADVHVLDLTKTGYVDTPRTVSVVGGQWPTLSDTPMPPGPGVLVACPITADTTWTAAGGSYFVAENCSVQEGVTLAAQPGTVVRFYEYTTFSIYGRLLAEGTAAAPVTLRSVKTSPSQPFYVDLTGATPLTSRISNATLSNGIVRTSGGSLEIERVAFSGAAQALNVSETGHPSVRFSTFVATSEGVHSSSTQTTAGSLNYWGAADGPSGDGPGTGAGVTGLVTYEPWFMAAPTTTHAFTGLAVINRTFNPAIGILGHLDFALSSSGSWTVSIYDSAARKVRTITGSGTSASVTWDGKNNQGKLQADGTYSYTAESVGPGNERAAALKGRFVLDSTVAFTYSGPTVSPSLFSPNGDGVKDTATVTMSCSFPDSLRTLRVRNGSGALVRVASWRSTSTYAWDGKNDSGVLVPDGVYSLEVTITNDAASASGTTSVTLDATAPVVVVSSPAAGVLSNLYNGGVTQIPVTGTATDANLTSWRTEWGAGTAPTTWTTLASGTSGVSGGSLGTWSTVSLQNGPYVLRLRVTDAAGTVSELLVPITLSNISVTASSRELNVASGQTVTLTTIAPVAVTHTVVLKDMAGSFVRTLVPGVSRPPGTFSDVWDGRGDGSVRIQDGQYRWVGTFTDGSHTLTIDRTAELDGDFEWRAHPGYPAWDPFANVPLRFAYTLDKPGEIGLVFMRTNYNLGLSCDPPSFCRWFDEFQPSGAFSYEWAGVDDDGVYRPDIKAIYVISNHEQLSANAVVVSGGRPRVTNVAVSPSYYGPDFGPATISFSLQTFQSVPVPITITLVNQETKSTLRTLSLPSATPGVVTTTWDGRTDAGLPVAPGLYTVTVKAQDAVGHVASGQIQLAVEY